MAPRAKIPYLFSLGLAVGGLTGCMGQEDESVAGYYRQPVVEDVTGRLTENQTDTACDMGAAGFPKGACDTQFCLVEAGVPVYTGQYEGTQAAIVDVSIDDRGSDGIFTNYDTSMVELPEFLLPRDRGLRGAVEDAINLGKIARDPENTCFTFVYREP